MGSEAVVDEKRFKRLAGGYLAATLKESQRLQATTGTHKQCSV